MNGSKNISNFQRTIAVSTMALGSLTLASCTNSVNTTFTLKAQQEAQIEQLCSAGPTPKNDIYNLIGGNLSPSIAMQASRQNETPLSVAITSVENDLAQDAPAIATLKTILDGKSATPSDVITKANAIINVLYSNKTLYTNDCTEVLDDVQAHGALIDIQPTNAREDDPQYYKVTTEQNGNTTVSYQFVDTASYPSTVNQPEELFQIKMTGLDPKAETLLQGSGFTNDGKFIFYGLPINSNTNNTTPSTLSSQPNSSSIDSNITNIPSGFSSLRVINGGGVTEGTVPEQNSGNARGQASGTQSESSQNGTDKTPSGGAGPSTSTTTPNTIPVTTTIPITSTTTPNTIPVTTTIPVTSTTTPNTIPVTTTTTPTTTTIPPFKSGTNQPSPNSGFNGE